MNGSQSSDIRVFLPVGAGVDVDVGRGRLRRPRFPLPSPSPARGFLACLPHQAIRKIPL
jgi:hypothetical protein